MFDVSQPQDQEGGIVHWEWDFGDHSRAWATVPVAKPEPAIPCVSPNEHGQTSLAVPLETAA